MKCERHLCPHAAVWLVRILFWSSVRTRSYLCQHHGDHLHAAMQGRHQVRWCRKVALDAAQESAA